MREVKLLALQVAHYESWFGDECSCDDDPCPLTLTPDPPSVADRAARDFHRHLEAGGSQPWAVWWDRYRNDYEVAPEERSVAAREDGKALDKFHEHIAAASAALEFVGRFDEDNGWYSSKSQLRHAMLELQSALSTYDSAKLTHHRR